MIRCAVSKGSSTARWLATLNRSYATSALRDGQFANSIDSTLEVASTAEGEGGGEGVEAADDVSKLTSNCKQPFKRRVLPVSPFMNPEALAARKKHHLPKPVPRKTLSPFQQQLAKNPYAQALATPVRQCQMNRLPMPRYFLQDFELMAHPETSEPWWVPTSLRTKHKTETLQDAEIEVEQFYELNGDSAAGSDSEGFSYDSGPQHTLPSYTPSLGPGTYVQSRQGLLATMHNPASGWLPQPQRAFVSGSISFSNFGRKIRASATWRSDMDTFVLELMRRRVVEGLAYLVQRKRGYVAGCTNWEEAKKPKKQQAAILWLGPSNGGEEAGPTNLRPEQQPIRNQASEQAGPPNFATLTIGKDKPHMVPVHNLLTLLGPEHLSELREREVLGEILVLKHKKNTVDVQMKLWKLQGYLGFPEPERDDDYIAKWKLARKRLGPHGFSQPQNDDSGQHRPSLRVSDRDQED